MGTNYYVEFDSCPHCNRQDPPLHIGKSSMGWVFSLRGYNGDEHPALPKDGIHTLEQWQEFWSQPDRVILNEYMMCVTPEKMLEEITERCHDTPCNWTPAIYEQNHARPGPGNLIRFDPDNKHSLGCPDFRPGPDGATYDWFYSEFS